MSYLVIDPKSLGAPRGYSNGMLARSVGRLLFVAGQVGWDREQRLVSSEFVPQFGRALGNVVTVVEAAGGRIEDLGRLTLYVVDKELYTRNLKAVGEAYRRIMGRHYPAMTLVEVVDLLEPGALVEIEGTAVVPTGEWVE